MRRLYARFMLILQGLVIFAGLFFYVTLHPKTTDFLAHVALENSGVRYSRIEGTLFRGFNLYDVRYQKAFFARHIGVHYSILKLFSPIPTIDKISLSNAKVYPDRFEFEESNMTKKSHLALPPIVIQTIEIDRCDVYVPDRIGFDMKVERLRWFREDVDIPSFSTRIRSPYANGQFKGSFHEMHLRAEGDASLSIAYKKTAEKFLEKSPGPLPIELRIDSDGLIATTQLKTPVHLRDINLSVEEAKLDFNYLFKENYFNANAFYHVKTAAIDADINQSFLFTPSLAYATKLTGEISQATHPLPSHQFQADAAGDTDVVVADFYMGAFNIGLYSTDYRQFAMHAKAIPHRIDYIEHLPELFSNQTISMEANATMQVDPEPELKGIVQLDGNYSRSKSFVEMKPGSFLVRASVEPKNIEGGIWESVPPMFKSQIHAYIYYSKENKLLNMSTQKSYLTLFEKEKRVKGWANIGSLTLDVVGNIEPDDTVDLHFHTHIDSLYALMQELDIKSDVTVDAEVESRFSVRIADWLSLRYETDIPWYLVQPDSQTVYYGLDSKLIGGIDGEEITIDRYNIGYKERRFDQKRISYFHFDENFNFYIDRFAILDTGELRGSFDLKKMRGNLRFDGERMHYIGQEGNVTASAGIDANISVEQVNIEGEMELLEANITYMPKKEYTISDEDIVIIQDIREPSHTRKSLNIRIFSEQPLDYRIPMIHVRFKPDVTIWKDPYKSTTLLGIVRVVDGAIDVEEKHFTIRPSEIYFRGAYPVNPYLDLHLLYEIDFNRFNIYVSHTLADPVFLFSSEPPMNQNDIMSYILFGTPADESFQGSRSTSASVASMLLGFGIKSAIGSATGLRFDTFNILNTEGGGLGVEIGKRIGKRMRIIYRNDTLSSFIIQYTISRSVRLDIDVHETGQGINVLYIKDFRDLGLFDSNKSR